MRITITIISSWGCLGGLKKYDNSLPQYLVHSLKKYLPIDVYVLHTILDAVGIEANKIKE